MNKSVFKILETLAENIIKKGYSIEGIELSYVDTKEKHLEVFTYSSHLYKKAFEEGFVKIGSLLFCDDTFKKSGVIIQDSKFRIISNDNISKGSHRPLEFSHFENPFSNENITTKPTYSEWITHYRNSNLNGVFFFYGKRKKHDFDLILFGVIDGLDKKQLKKDVRNLLKKFTEELDDFSMVFERLRKSRKEMIEQATHSAISQVMARNTSHNIGAHVMNKLIGDLSKIKLEDFKNYTGGLELYKGEDSNKKLLDQISIFNNYVKCRMDYLADISFGTPMMQTNKYVFGDLFTEFDKVRLLLEHISGLDKFNFEIKFTHNGKEFMKESNVKGEDDLLVAIPNDILGMQAFYNILENIIRNTAKHAKNKKEKTIFTVNFIDDIECVFDYCEENNCESTICEKTHKKEIENVLKEFIAVEIFNNTPETEIDGLVYNLNSKLNEDILDKNKLRSHSLGLVEMDASAAYLRKLSVENINASCYDILHDESWSRNTQLKYDNQNSGETNCLYFLKAINRTNTINKENYLGYRIFLHRPAVVLVVTSKIIIKAKKDKLQKEGVWIIDPTDFQKQLKDGKVFPHEFVVVDNNITFEAVKVEIPEKGSEQNNNTVEIKFLEYYKTSLPIRILMIENKDDICVLYGKKLEDWEKFCWEKWVTDTIPIFGGYNSQCNDPQAVLLDHLYSKNSLNNSEEMWNGSLKAYHLEALSSLAQFKLPDFVKHTKSINESNEKLQNYIDTITKPKNEQISGKCVVKRENAYKKIVEAVQTKVIVIDERIQNTTKELNEGGREFITISYKDLYKKMNVIVPDKSNINLSENSFENIKICLENYIENVITGSKSTDFILIHYSILERMYKKDEIKTKIDKWAESINVVITSGRGIPNNLSEKVRFVNLSSVITAVVDVRSKYAINYLLNSSRKSNII